VVAGTEVARAVFAEVDGSLEVDVVAGDAAAVGPGAVVMRLAGRRVPS
jgi:nicotinate-nucleotide pyrophosphorylase